MFCAQCGAPQVRLSEELKERAEARAAGADGGEGAATPADPSGFDAAGLVRRDVLRFGVFSAGVAATFAVLTAFVPPILLFGCLWAVVSPIVLVGMFHTRNPKVAITTGFGAHMGLVAGLGNAFTTGTLYSLLLFAARRAHVMGDSDRNTQNVIHDYQAQIAAQSAADANPALMHWAQSLNVPEFRAGMMLAGFGMCLVLLLIVSTAGGAFAGYMRSRRG